MPPEEAPPQDIDTCKQNCFPWIHSFAAGGPSVRRARFGRSLAEGLHADIQVFNAHLQIMCIHTGGQTSSANSGRAFVVGQLHGVRFVLQVEQAWLLGGGQQCAWSGVPVQSQEKLDAARVRPGQLDMMISAFGRQNKHVRMVLLGRPVLLPGPHEAAAFGGGTATL